MADKPRRKRQYQYNIFVGCDGQGDNCLYIQIAPMTKVEDDTEPEWRYLSEGELEPIQEALDTLLNRGGV